MRRAGYGEKPGFKGQMSYTRRIHGAPFPRLHGYIEERGGGIEINLHLDQKEHTYEGSHAHSGEYEGAVVEREMGRLTTFIRSLISGAASKPPTPSKPSGGFWSSLFG